MMPEIDVTQTEQSGSQGELAAGSIFAERFEISGKLGSGGMSVVYKARQVAMERMVALKVMHTWMAVNGKAHQRFQREAHAVSLLDHPNIVKVHSFGIEGAYSYLAMEYLEGKTLSQVLQEKGKLTQQETLDMAIPAARALSHAHSQGIVHRDIKPGNIMIRQDGIVQLVDFGVAKILDEENAEQKLTQTNALVGTPYYMSPEQCERSTELDARCDIYALGCVLYECLCGTKVFEGDSAFSVMYSHIHDTAPRLPNDVADWLAAVTAKMLEKNPLNRFQSMSDVLDCLEAAAPPSVRPGVQNKRSRRRKSKQLVPMVACTILAAALGFVAFLAIRPPVTSELPTQVPDVRSLKEAWAEGYKCLEKWKESGSPDPVQDLNGRKANAFFARAVQLSERTDGKDKAADLQWNISTMWGYPHGFLVAQDALDKKLSEFSRHLAEENAFRNGMEIRRRFNEYRQNYGKIPGFPLTKWAESQCDLSAWLYMLAPPGDKTQISEAMLKYSELDPHVSALWRMRALDTFLISRSLSPEEQRGYLRRILDQVPKLSMASNTDRIVAMETLDRDCNVAQQGKNFKEAYELYEALAQIADGTYGAQSVEAIHCKSVLGYIYFAEGKSAQAEKTFRKSYPVLAEGARVHQDRALAQMETLRDICYKRSDNKSVVELLEQAVRVMKTRIAVRSTDEKGLLDRQADYYTQLANNYVCLGQLQKAHDSVTLAQASLKASETKNNPLYLSLWNADADVAMAQGDWKAGKRAAANALDAMRSLPLRWETPGAWNRASVCAENLGELGAAVEYKTKAVDAMAALYRQKTFAYNDGNYKMWHQWEAQRDALRARANHAH